MSLATNPMSAVKAKLPLWDTICLSYATYFQNFTDVLRSSWLWLMVVGALMAIVNWQQWSWMAQIMERGMTPQMLATARASKPLEATALDSVAELVFLLAGVSIAVAWHRRMILDEHPGISGSNVATKDLWRYVLVGLALCLLVILPPLVMLVPILYFLSPFAAGTVPGSPPPAGFFVLIPVVLLLYLVTVAVMLRLSLLLPARAVGDVSLTFKQTWNGTRGNAWRIFWGLIACTVPPTLIVQIAFLALVGFPRPDMFGGEAFVERMTVFSTVFIIYYLLIVPIGIGFLSHSYRYFFQAHAEQAP